MIKLFLLKFRDRNKDKQLRSLGSAPSNKLQSLRTKDTMKLNPDALGNNKLVGSWVGKKQSFNKSCGAQMRESPCRSHDLGG